MHSFAELASPLFWSREGFDLLGTVLKVLQVLVIYLVGRFLINRSARRIARTAAYGAQHFGSTSAGREARFRTIIALIRSIGLYVLFFVCAVLLMRALNFDAVSILTSASVAGIAVGLGAQKLFRDVIAGFFIILENQYAIGDYVTINGAVSGRVEEMGMRIVKIRDDTGKLFIYANGDITVVCNQSRGAIASVVELGVPPASDMAKVREAIEAAAAQVYARAKDLGYTKPPEVQGIGGGDSTRTIVRVEIEANNPAALPLAAVALRDAAHDKLVEAGITPF